MTRLLIDAHALLWWLGDDQRLSERARGLIEDADELLVGAGTIAEIAIKQSIGHRDPFDRLLVAQAISERIPIVTRDPAFAAYSAAALW